MVHGAHPLRLSFNAAMEAKIWVFEACNIMFQKFIIVINAVIVCHITGMWSNLEGTIILRRFQRLADDGESRYTSALQMIRKCT